MGWNPINAGRAAQDAPDTLEAGLAVPDVTAPQAWWEQLPFKAILAIYIISTIAVIAIMWSGMRSRNLQTR